jgi:predicted negative regulator of RcsB-dependent stress response|tara:strand:+ start:106 stop:750 length:645 start_codon:yes stop_codon:yes gene_type:complete
MDEDISIINSNTRNEKIKNFFINNKKSLILILSLIILMVFSFFVYSEIQEKKNKNLALKYNNTIIKFDTLNKINVKNELIEIIYKKNSTYSPLALYFIIDNEIQASNEEINNYFDVLINETDLDKEVKNLIIYKKGLFNADFETENNLITILKPVVNSDSIWKSHALYLIAEYFFEKNQKQKAKEFFTQILNNEKSNKKIVLETKKRLIKDFNE